MKIAIGNDHRGVEIKLRLLPLLRSLGHEVLDIGTEAAESVDYPDYAYEVGKRVGSGEMERGLLICGTGIGMSMAANKVRNVRAAACQDVLTAGIKGRTTRTRKRHRMAHLSKNESRMEHGSNTDKKLRVVFIRV